LVDAERGGDSLGEAIDDGDDVGSDAVFHIAFGRLLLAIAAVQLNRDRATP